MGKAEQNSLIEPASRVGASSISAGSLEALWGMPEPSSFSEKQDWVAKKFDIYGEQPWIAPLRDQEEEFFQPAFWREHLHGFEAAGLRLELPDYSDSGQENPYIEDTLGWLDIHANIYSGDQLAGIATFGAEPCVDGSKELRMKTVKLDPGADSAGRPYQGRGFGASLVNRLEDICRQAGAARISLHSVGDGCYSWARMGFEIDPRSEVGGAFGGGTCLADFGSAAEYERAFLDRLASKLIDRAENPLSNLGDYQVKTYAEAISGERINSLSDFIEVVRDLPDGRKLMHGNEWCGVKIIEPA